MLRKLVAAILLFLVSCDPNGESSTTIRSGLYETDLQLVSGGELLRGKSQIAFGSGFLQTVYVNSEVLFERKGDWEVGGGALKFRNILTRYQTAPGAWGPWESEEYRTLKVRNISETAFQWLLEVPDGESKETWEASGVDFGWKTYNRIGS